MPAVLFGSISTLADTSELQREAFNQAFAVHGLGWTWGREDYLAMLEDSGGQDRVAAYALSRGETVDAGAVHASKSEIFRASLAQAPVRPRPGVVETVRAAKDKGLKVALVTTTSGENVTALLGALEPHVQASDFDLVVDASHVERPKPDGAAYAFALRTLDEVADDCVAIEDNLHGVDAAVAAGLVCIAFPNENTAGHAFDKAQVVVDRLAPADVQQFVLR